MNGKFRRSAKQKWWYRWIRTLNWFSFRYYWFVWLLFIGTLIPLIWCLSQPTKTNECRTIAPKIIENIHKELSDCCACSEKKKDSLIFPADYLIITYHFKRSSGKDLDTKTEITSPTQKGPLGFFHKGEINNARPHLIWSDDNTGYGVESCLIDLTQFGTNDLVTAECSAVWFSKRLSGDMSLDVKAYEGGTMSLSNFQWSNTGGRQTAETSFEGNVKNTGDKVNLLEQVGKITYDKRKKKLVFEPALNSH
jgi:hypothetical protein